MGRRGHVQTRPPKFGACITDWAQSAFYSFLESNGLEVSSLDGEFVNVEDADHWEIQIPCKKVGRGKDSKCVDDYEAIDKLVARLRKSPGLVEEGGVSYGSEAASVLEEGVAAARKYKLSSIEIEWF